MAVGMTAEVTTTEAVTGIRGWYGSPLTNAVTIGSTATDAGSTPTTTLRPGLVLAKKTSDGQYYPHSPSSTHGTQYALCVLAAGVNMLDNTGTAVAQSGCIVFDGGHMDPSGWITSSQSGAFLNLARRQLEGSGKFTFNDDPSAAAKGMVQRAAYEVTKTAAYTILAADNGTRFDTTGATASVTLTLPAIASGLEYMVRAGAAQTVIVASAEGSNIVAKNNLTASNLAYSTSNSIIGGTLSIKSNAAGTKWDAINVSGDCTLSVY